MERSHCKQDHGRTLVRVLSYGFSCIVSLFSALSLYLLSSFLASFFGEVIRIGSPDYLPDVTDVLRARQKSVGITETRFTMGQLSSVFLFLDLSHFLLRLLLWCHWWPAADFHIFRQNTYVWRGRSTVREKKMDPLFWISDVDYLLYRPERIRSRLVGGKIPGLFPCLWIIALITSYPLESYGGIAGLVRISY